MEISCRRFLRNGCAFFLYVFQSADWLAAVVSTLPEPLQAALLSHFVGANVPAIVPLMLSFVNGMAILGFLFARIYQFLPGRSGVIKGLTFGLIGWVMMGLISFR